MIEERHITSTAAGEDGRQRGAGAASSEGAEVGDALLLEDVDKVLARRIVVQHLEHRVEERGERQRLIRGAGRLGETGEQGEGVSLGAEVVRLHDLHHDVANERQRRRVAALDGRNHLRTGHAGEGELDSVGRHLDALNLGGRGD